MYADSHAHFGGLGAEEACGQVSAAEAAGVEWILAVGGSAELNAGARLVGLHCGAVVRVALGFDRSEAGRLLGGGAAGGVAGAAVAVLLDGLAADGLVAAGLGEIGLDFHYERETRREQMGLCEEQLAVARARGLPVVWHSREADRESLELLGNHARLWRGPADRLGVVHCFTGGPAQARMLLDLGLHISFSGIVTFPKAEEIRRAAAYVPGDRLLAETDTPYLAPVPLRGQRNEPANVRYVVETLARLRGAELAETAGLTLVNARNLFGGPAASGVGVVGMGAG